MEMKIWRCEEPPITRQSFYAKRLRALRLGLGMSQWHFAEILGVHPSSLSRWERGISDIPVSLLLELYKNFGILPGVFVEQTYSQEFLLAHARLHRAQWRKVSGKKSPGTARKKRK